MTYTDDFSKLSTSLDHFNSVLDGADKLDEKALRTIQNYLNDSTVRVLKQEDENKMQRPLKQLELLNDQVTLNRVKLIDMKEINRQIIRLAEMINKKPEQTKKNAYFTIIKLEVCFLKILSEEAANDSKKWRDLYEEKMNMKVVTGPSGSTSYTSAKRTNEQQCVVNELMNAALFNVITYFQEKSECFTDQFTQEFLDLLEQNIDNPNQPAPDKAIDDMKEILTKTAEICQLSINYLISQLRYAIIGFDERVNRYSIPFLRYITNTESPTLEGFNKTLGFSAALSSEEVEKFEPLFQLYRKDLLSPQKDESSNAATTDTPAVRPEKSIRSDLPPSPPIKKELDLKFIWITPFIPDQHKEYCTLLRPMLKVPETLSIVELKTKISNELLGCRIFLCVSATEMHDLLSSIHEKPELYLVYVLCQNQAEEDKIQKETEKFNKIRITTSIEEEFIRQLASDIVPSYIEVGDIHFGAVDKTNARRWYRSIREKVEKYGDDSLKNNYLPIIKEKIEQC